MIDEQLTRGTIRQTTFPFPVPVLLTGKKDGNLQPFFQYGLLNSGPVKNRWPLPLTMELIKNFHDADAYTNSEIFDMYVNLQVAKGNENKMAFLF